jgi:hypothetical protein
MSLFKFLCLLFLRVVSGRNLVVSFPLEYIRIYAAFDFGEVGTIKTRFPMVNCSLKPGFQTPLKPGFEVRIHLFAKFS